MTDKQLAALVKQLAGSDGWFHNENYERFLKAAKALRDVEFSDDELEALLTNFYTAVAGEFGG